MDYMYDLIYQLKDLLETLGVLTTIGFVVWLYYRHKMRAGERENDLMIRALEKSENAEEVLRQLQKPRKSRRERLMGRLTWGWCLAVAGVLLVLLPFVYGIIVVHQGVYVWADVIEELGPFSFIGAPALGVGIGFLVSYFVGKKTLNENE